MDTPAESTETLSYRLALMKARAAPNTDPLVLFNALQSPIWIFDIDHMRMWWANHSALSLWNASSIEELLGRDWSDYSEATRIRLHTNLQQFQQGKTIVEQWTFYPQGRAVSVRCVCSGIAIESGRLAMLVEGVPDVMDRLDSDTLRSVEALRHTSVMISLYTWDGIPLMQNPASLRCYGDLKSASETSEHRLNGRFADPSIPIEAMSCMSLGKVFSIETQVITLDGIRWHGIDLRRSNDPATGAPLILVNEKDITERVHAEAALQESYVLLEQAQEALRQANEELEQRVLQRTAALKEANKQLQLEMSTRQQVEDALRSSEQQLKEANSDLIRSNRDLEQFAYVASHDLQEPLRAVTSYAQLFARKYQGNLDAKADKYINYMVEGAIRMQQLIEDLLEFSRVGTRGKELTLTDSEAVLSQVLANLRVAIAQSQATVTHDPLPTVMGDETQLVQLLQNLIGNAIKFCREEPPKVHIKAVHSDNQWIFSVRDNGIGMESEYFERIFTIFQRLHNKSQYPGTGIGLAVCKKIVERHGGRIWVESELGVGTTFYFSILL